MGKVKRVKPVKLITGFIFKNEADLEKAQAALISRFGRIDFISEIIPFDQTDYYKAEMGLGLKRVFLSFHKLINPSRLPAIKRLTNNIEVKFSLRGNRLINIDPGYLDLAKVVLASTKDYCHRVYLDKGVFAEITLFFRGDSFRPWEWTYPDYRKTEYIAVFNKIRELYLGRRI
ncbi:MAG: DUF4416 family protein [Candidatus Omnitrophota bacterium]|jgi:hypothetical protein